MAGTANPRQVVRELLERNKPSRPLFLPIVFSLGAQIENVPLRTYLANPTKIVSALRQIHARVGADGVSCYFDPFLEAEALGGTLEWETEDGPPRLVWPGGVAESGLPRGIRSAEDAAKSGRVPVAAEVIRRMKEALRDSALLMVGLRGPIALSVEIVKGREGGDRHPPAAAVELAGTALSEIARALLEAGASAVVIREEVPSKFNSDRGEEGAEHLSALINVARFYEALPVFLCRGGTNIGDTLMKLVRAARGAKPCMAPPRASYDVHDSELEAGPGTWSFALPPEAFSEDETSYASFEKGLQRLIAAGRPALMTTWDDVPQTTDTKRLAQVNGMLAARA